MPHCKICSSAIITYKPNQSEGTRTGIYNGYFHITSQLFKDKHICLKLVDYNEMLEYDGTFLDHMPPGAKTTLRYSTNTTYLGENNLCLYPNEYGDNEINSQFKQITTDGGGHWYNIEIWCTVGKEITNLFKRKLIYNNWTRSYELSY